MRGEWLYKGNSNKRVELGHNILVTSDQWGFIVDHVVVEKQSAGRQVRPDKAKIEEIS